MLLLDSFIRLLVVVVVVLAPPDFSEVIQAAATYRQPERDQSAAEDYRGSARLARVNASSGNSMKIIRTSTYIINYKVTYEACMSTNFRA